MNKYHYTYKILAILFLLFFCFNTSVFSASKAVNKAPVTKKKASPTSVKPVRPVTPKTSKMIALPNLMVQSIIFKKPAMEGNKIQPIAVITIKNMGKAESGKCKINIKASAKSKTRLPKALKSSTFNLSAIAPGASAKVNWPAAAKESWPAGRYVLSVKVDSTNMVKESDERRNQKTAKFEVKGKPVSAKRLAAPPSKQKINTAKKTKKGISRISRIKIPTSSTEGTGSQGQDAAPQGPSINVTAPSAGTRWCVDNQYYVEWNSTQISGNVKIEVLVSWGEVRHTIASNTANDGSHQWTIPLTNFNFGSGSYRIRITALDNSASDQSDLFTIGKQLTLSEPKSNRIWRKGSDYPIKWNQVCDLPASLNIKLYDSSHQFVQNVSAGLSTASSSSYKTYNWAVPTNLASGVYYIKLITNDNQLSDESSFNIDDPMAAPLSSPDITFTQPTANTRWCVNNQYTIQWDSTLPPSTNVKIEVITSWGELRHTIASSTPNDGSYQWTIPLPNFNFGSGSYRIKIGTLNNSAVTESALFTIGKQLSLTEPKSNRIWRKGNQHTIRWTQVCDLPSPLNIKLYNSSHQFVENIVTGLSTASSASGKTHQWSVPTSLSSGVYYIKVITNDSQFSDESSFNVADPL